MPSIFYLMLRSARRARLDARTALLQCSLTRFAQFADSLFRGGDDTDDIEQGVPTQRAQPSFPRKRESRRFNGLWIPALRFATAGMTNWDGRGLFPHPANAESVTIVSACERHPDWSASIARRPLLIAGLSQSARGARIYARLDTTEKRHDSLTARRHDGCHARRR
jgi:hypothetical protein